MKLSILSDIVCPSAKDEMPCHGSLTLAEDFPTLGDERDIVEGLLRCADCGASYPILCGLPILLPETLTWLRKNYTVVLSVAAGQGMPLSRAMLDYLHQRGAHIPVRDAAGDWNYSAANRISLYLCAHYDNVLDTLAPSHPLLSFLQSYYENDLYTILVKMLTPYLDTTQYTLDIGCNVGRMSRELAARCGMVYGVDLAFAAALAARRALLGLPSPITSYELFRDGHIRQARALDFPPVQNAEVLIASGTQLPFPDAVFDVVNSSNVIDVVPNPAQLPREKARVLKGDGLCAMTDPYCWEISAPVEKWPGGREDIPSVEGVRQLLASSFDILAEADDVPWVLREHDRKFSTYLNHCLVARKRMAAQGGRDEL